MRKLLVLIALIIAVPACAVYLHAADEEPGRPEYTILRRTEPIVIVGVLDDPDWERCESLGPLKFPWYNYEKHEETQAAELEITHVKLLWDDDFLYIAYVCEDMVLNLRNLIISNNAFLWGVVMPGREFMYLV